MDNIIVISQLCQLFPYKMLLEIHNEINFRKNTKEKQKSEKVLESTITLYDDDELFLWYDSPTKGV